MFKVYEVIKQDAAQVCLRRYISGPCPAWPGDGKYSRHDASGPILEGGWPRSKPIPSYPGGAHTLYPASDPRWPVACACGYEFQPGDEWQIFTQSLYLNPLDGSLKTKEELAPGAIFRIELYEDDTSWCGEDGKSYGLICPGGSNPRNQLWTIDVPHGNGRWTRRGVVPETVTAMPSILFTYPGGFHGYLLNGVLYDYDHEQIPAEAWVQR